MITMISIARELVPFGTGSFADFIPVARLLVRGLSPRLYLLVRVSSAQLVPVGTGLFNMTLFVM